MEILLLFLFKCVCVFTPFCVLSTRFGSIFQFSLSPLCSSRIFLLTPFMDSTKTKAACTLTDIESLFPFIQLGANREHCLFCRLMKKHPRNSFSFLIFIQFCSKALRHFTIYKVLELWICLWIRESCIKLFMYTGKRRVTLFWILNRIRALREGAIWNEVFLYKIELNQESSVRKIDLMMTRTWRT